MSLNEEMSGVEFVQLFGKGMGMKAKKEFKIGDLVLRECPLVLMPDSVFDAENERTERWLDKKINAMTCNDRADFYGLSDCRNVDDKTTLGIFFTNCMTFVNDSAALFPKIARANHSCQPNTEFLARTSLMVQDLIAVRNISKGDEITLSYMPAGEEGSGDAETRRQYLREWYGFQCMCRACVVGDNDVTRRQIRKLQKRGIDNLSLYELELLADSLEGIASKIDYLDFINQAMYDKALEQNDRVLAAKSFSSAHLYKTIKSCPEKDNWITMFKTSKSVLISGRWYLFPPDF